MHRRAWGKCPLLPRVGRWLMGVFNRATWRMPGLRDPGVTSGVPGFPAATKNMHVPMHVQNLDSTGREEHHSQESAGLDLSPVTVLRCQGHPGNAAGPAHPPAGPCGRGPAASARAPHPARDQAHRPQKARPRRRARKPRLTATSGTTARHATGSGPGTSRAGNSRPARKGRQSAWAATAPRLWQDA